ncbi:cystathionine beta-lyase [Anaeroplasma bactoclasticum]|jgi:cystathionine beta-lyase|uniref:cysteine-S-conjugate beta-lyase n=1 Tax=Anaeroplasma bactoclasticum TaxID=2088 RepID=A0A397QTD6_9MOLU|nr:PatB family C-S lyase [Anaeroplasma bactoclasticum]RIA64850.1 cystathionine beta-lyase [Anaeroplasma bactoclasticum]
MYDFSKKINRKNSNSYKWDSVDATLPMWVADMDFEACPDIIDAIKKRMECPVFGYSITPKEYFLAYQAWWERRHHIKFDLDWMIFSTGVVPTISSTVRKLTTVGEKVLIMAPVYNIFYNSIINNGRFVLSSDLVYENNEYHIDFNDLEKKMSDPQVSLMILCNPHNPVGKIWSFDDLKKIGSLSVKYNVIVLSDEIHCDIVEKGYEYIPYMSVSEECKMNSVTAISATKCFGIPGLQSSAVVIPNPILRHKVNRGLNTDECAEGNVFAFDPIIAAFSKGEAWVNEMNDYVTNNKKVFMEELKDTNLIFVDANALYLLWVDVSKYTLDSKRLVKFIKDETGLYITEGSEYGESGKSFVRINLATTLDNVLDSTRRMKQALQLYKE